MTPPPYTTATDQAAAKLREELDALTAERLLEAIRGGRYLETTSEQVRRDAFETFVLAKLAALQVRTSPPPTA